MSIQSIAAGGNTPLPRFGHTLTYYSPGKVVLFGGATGHASQYSITDSTYTFDLSTKIWSKVLTTGTIPSPRAAHGAVSHQTNQLLVYGGAAAARALASDDLFLLDLKDNIGVWNTINVVGKTPGKRYGHTLSYSKPNLIVFGGNSQDMQTNDCWILDIQQRTISWMQVKCQGELPPPRVYHTAALCSVGSAKGMVIIFGGRSKDKDALNDIWGLTRHRNNTYEWLRAPQKGSCIPIGRYQHSCAFMGHMMIVVGGRTDQLDEPLPLQVYDMMKNQWSSHGCIERFRHDCFVDGHDLYIFGGFNLKVPNLPTDNLTKITMSNFMKGNFVEESSSRSNIIGGNTPTGNASRMIQPMTTQNTSNIMNNSRRQEKSQKPQSKFRLLEPVIVQGESRMRSNDSHRTATLKNDIAAFFLNSLCQPQHCRNIEKIIFNPRPNNIAALCDIVQDIVRQQSMVLRVTAPVKIFGDIHGQFADLLSFFNLYGSPHLNGKKNDIENFDYVFIGDFVDRGSHSLQTIVLLMALKATYPSQIHLIRGNHEDIGINTDFGFMEECADKCQEDTQNPDSIFQRINRLFTWLPLAAVVQDQILCIHGGIGSHVHTIEDIEQIQRPVEVVQEVTTRDHKLILDILWSDPTESDAELGIQSNDIRDPNKTGNIVKYGPDRVHEFLKKNNLGMIVRAHECVMDGFERFAGGALITIFSATDYCRRHKNSGAILIVKKNMQITPKLIMPSSNDDNNWIDTEEQLKKRPPTPPRHVHRT